MIQPGDHVMYMARCAIVLRVFETTANIRFTGPVRDPSPQLSVYLRDIIIQKGWHDASCPEATS